LKIPLVWEVYRAFQEDHQEDDVAGSREAQWLVMVVQVQESASGQNHRHENAQRPAKLPEQVTDEPQVDSQPGRDGQMGNHQSATSQDHAETPVAMNVEKIKEGSPQRRPCPAQYQRRRRQSNR